MSIARQSLVVLAALVASAGALAQEASFEGASALSTASRHTVIQQAVAARAANLVGYGEASGHDFARDVASTLSRAQVSAEAREAQRLGLTQVGEVQRFATPDQLESARRAGGRDATSVTASR